MLTTGGGSRPTITPSRGLTNHVIKVESGRRSPAGLGTFDDSDDRNRACRVRSGERLRWLAVAGGQMAQGAAGRLSS